MIAKPFISASIIFLSFFFCSYNIKKGGVISAKSIDQNLAQVKDGLFAYKYETSNADYSAFLSYIQQNKPSLYNECKIDSAKWKNEPMASYYYRHPAYGNYPVLNISYNGATEYCKWLTEKYNTDAKRKFRKVEFILPTEEEWVIAAQGGKKNAVYPWGNTYSLRNGKGEFLCNFKRIGEAFVISDSKGNPVFKKEAIEMSLSGLSDRAFYTAEVKSFYPNSIGLYNLCGNVAEMLLDKGETKGGSWNSYGGEVTIQSKKTYTESSPEVGFRVFMKVIEK